MKHTPLNNGKTETLSRNLNVGMRVFLLNCVGKRQTAEGPYEIFEEVRSGTRLTGFVLTSADSRGIVVYKGVSKNSVIPEEWIKSCLTGQKSDAEPAEKVKSSKG